MRYLHSTEQGAPVSSATHLSCPGEQKSKIINRATQRKTQHQRPILEQQKHHATQSKTCQEDQLQKKKTHKLGFHRMVIWVNPSAPQLH